VTSRNSSKPGNGALGAPPTDLELMLYADGELDEARHREVEAHITRDAQRRAKLAGLDITGALLRERAASPALADGIADAVMARILKESTNGVGAGAARAQAPANKAEAGAPEALQPSGGELRDIRSGAQKKPAGTSFDKRPANDNARGIFALAALAAAAAAALMIWGRMEAEPPRAMNTTQPPADTHVTPELAPTPAPSPEPGDEANPGVEVAAVDFGARMGTIFYIPTGSSASSPTTTVVWLSDDVMGGQ